MTLQSSDTNGAEPLADKIGRHLRSFTESAAGTGLVARERARDLGHTAGRQIGDAGRKGVAQVRQAPIPTALIVAGVGAGLFLLLNAKARTAAIGAAGTLWQAYKKAR